MKDKTIIKKDKKFEKIDKIQKNLQNVNNIMSEKKTIKAESNFYSK
jgi:hypothetical protein